MTAKAVNYNEQRIRLLEAVDLNKVSKKSAEVVRKTLDSLKAVSVATRRKGVNIHKVDYNGEIVLAYDLTADAPTKRYRGYKTFKLLDESLAGDRTVYAVLANGRWTVVETRKIDMLLAKMIELKDIVESIND